MRAERVGAMLRRGASTSSKAAAQNAPAVILGGRVTALSVARSLTGAGVEVYTLDDRDSPARASRMRGTFVDIGCDAMTQDRMLEWLRSGPHGAVVLACSDDGLELIARHRAELVELEYLPMEADDEVLLAMLDKERTDALAREHGIPVPRVVPLHDQADLDRVGREFSYPCVLKPVHSHIFARRTKSRAKVLTVDSPAELHETFERMSAIGVEMLAIEVIAGADDEYVSYYSYLDERGEPLLHLTKRKIRQYPNRFGSGTYHATTRDPEVAELGLRFFRAVGLRGLGNVEFKRDGNDGQLKLIECNARFTMSNELIRVAGIDLALLSYNRLLGRPAPPVDRYREDLRLWNPIRDTLAFLEYRRHGELSFGRWVGSLLRPQHFAVSRIDDPLPSLLGIARSIRRAPGRRFRPRRTVKARSSPVVYARSELTERIGANGRRGFALASRLDLLYSTGPGYTWRRLRAERHLSVLGGQARHAIYERIWREAADATGAELEQLAPGLFELKRDGLATRVFHQMVELDDPVALQVALDKPLVHRLLTTAGLSIPEHQEFDARNPSAALAFLAQADGPCVVKPAAGTGGGHGTTAGIHSPAELMRARLRAGSDSERLLVERQVRGDVYRLLLLEGELLDVVRSTNGHLTGDGRSTLEELLVAENERRVEAQGSSGLSLLGVNLDMMLVLERAGMTLSSVPSSGQRVAIGSVTNNNGVEDNQTYRGLLAPELIAEARSAQSVIGLRLAGLDVITSDPTRPLVETGGAITEVNGTPGLHHHYLVADPHSATRVAIPILERLLSRAAWTPFQPDGVGEPSRSVLPEPESA
jgi:predicted ATP-grasp superfamily ATP-dependent carboligase